MQRLIKTLLICSLLSSCAYTDTINTDVDSYTVVVVFYDDNRAIESVCGKGNVGCWRKSGNLHTIHTTRSKCVLYHEIDHILYGYFHNQKAGCNIRGF
jgi:hypothetical protein